nr:MAG TPA: hypothetical protein [Caudoviricetes sp.]
MVNCVILFHILVVYYHVSFVMSTLFSQLGCLFS